MHYPRKKNPRKSLWGKTAMGLKVYLVDGPIIRRDYDIDYTEGGTHPRYKWIPDKEVWIEDEETMQERKFVLLHELHERRLMTRGMSYDNAHEKASKVELRCRKYPDELVAALKLEGWINNGNSE